MYVLLISVLTHTSHVCAVRANCAASLSTTKVCHIANGGNTSFDTFPLESSAATHHATFFSACSMNCGADAAGHRVNVSFTVNT